MAAGGRQGWSEFLGAFVLQSDVGFVQENLRVIEQVSLRPACSPYSLGVFAHFILVHISYICLVREGVASTSADVRWA